jgi:hypothetical protein
MYLALLSINLLVTQQQKELVSALQETLTTVQSITLPMNPSLHSQVHVKEKIKAVLNVCGFVIANGQVFYIKNYFIKPFFEESTPC